MISSICAPSIYILIIVLVLFMSVGAIFALHLRDLLSAVIVMGVVDLIAAILFLILQAPDVAITQAAVGAGLTTAIFVIAIVRSTRKEK
ncbi:MAG TPA: DUF4040 domain-containing protein [candidate division WOR-3 bacterium]|uniref:DUF4040 domain-containing protein n=1 Tax=candidate division WOR-3 bacterium TaxID=2052148 RepID=A0A7C5DC95_UNCW3|nr:DUF4040 domain-containing protein [candidate division WOR-3 bacterium]